MKRISIRLFGVVHVIGLAAFLGSVFALIAVAQSHDSSGNWLEIAAGRADVMTIIRFVTKPGLVVTLISGILLLVQMKGLLHNRLMRWKGILVLLLVINSHFIVIPAAQELYEIALSASASQAQMPDSSSLVSTERFQAVLFRENIAGAVNLLLFISLTYLGLQLTRSKKRQP